jgi:hypothetical protein
MGKGGITMDQGMSQEEYRALQYEERQWQETLEEKKYARAKEFEQQRLEFESAQKEKLTAQKKAEEMALEKGESTLKAEIKAQKKDDEDNLMAGDFYTALSKNASINPRPE